MVFKIFGAYNGNKGVISESLFEIMYGLILLASSVNFIVFFIYGHFVKHEKVHLCRLFCI